MEALTEAATAAAEDAMDAANEHDLAPHAATNVAETTVKITFPRGGVSVQVFKEFQQQLEKLGVVDLKVDSSVYRGELPTISFEVREDKAQVFLELAEDFFKTRDTDVEVSATKSVPRSPLLRHSVYMHYYDKYSLMELSELLRIQKSSRPRVELPSCSRIR